MSNVDKFNSTIYNSTYNSWKSWGRDNFGDLSYLSFFYFENIFKKINKIKIVNKKINILEIGFGNGDFLKFCSLKEFNVRGTECNKSLYDVATQNEYDVSLSANIDHFENNSFDLIFAFDVLEHLSTESLFSLFSDAHTRLADKGIFVARFPNGDSPLGLVNQNGDFSHLSTIGSGKIKFLSETYGYEIKYIGKDINPILVPSWRHFFHRIYLAAVTTVVNYFVNVTFFPRRNVAYCSQNMLVILQKKNG